MLPVADRIYDFLVKNGASDEVTICESLGISHGSFFYGVRGLGRRVNSFTLNRKKIYSLPESVADDRAVDRRADERPIAKPRTKKPPSLGGLSVDKTAPIRPDYDDRTCAGVFPSVSDFCDVVQSVIDGAVVIDHQVDNRRVIVEIDGDLRRYDYRPIPGGVEVREFELGGISWKYNPVS